MDWKTQKVLVAGSGKSGIGATDLLKKVGAKVIIYDGNDKLKEEDVLNKLENKEDVKVILGELEDSVINEIDIMVLSPGIAIDAPFVLRVKEAGVPIWGEIELAYVIGKGKLAAQIFMERKLDATAVICFNDEFAIGMIRGFQELDVKVPDQISVMGIDGTGTRKYLSPTLTTINMFPQKQGQECANILIDMIEKTNKRYMVHIKPKLQLGESVKNLRV